MSRSAATAGVLSAAVLLSSGCGRGQDAGRGAAAEPVRLAAYRALVAREFLATCPSASNRTETERADERYDELKGFAVRKGAGQSLWLAENQYAGVARFGGRERCAAGEAAFVQALAAFNVALDELGGRIGAIVQ